MSDRTRMWLVARARRSRQSGRIGLCRLDEKPVVFGSVRQSEPCVLILVTATPRGKLWPVGSILSATWRDPHVWGRGEHDPRARTPERCAAPPLATIATAPIRSAAPRPADRVSVAQRASIERISPSRGLSHDTNWFDWLRSVTLADTTQWVQAGRVVVNVRLFQPSECQTIKS